MAAQNLGHRDMLKIVAWTIVANAAALAAIAYVLAPQIYRDEVIARVSGWLRFEAIAPAKSGLNVSYIAKIDPAAAEALRKRSLNLTLVPKAVQEIVAGAEPSGEQQEYPATGDVSLDTGAYEEVKAMAIEPVLKSSSKQGRPEIGSFSPITVSGSSDACVQLGHLMLQEARASENLLNVMVDTAAITIARICTANGAVFLTCRSNQITISPRKSRPDDGC